MLAASVGTTSSCFSAEAIYTISPDFVAAACKFCIGLLQDLEDDLPMWAEPHVGTEDMKAAYRQLPNDPDEQTGLFIAFYDPNDHQVKYVHLRAHPFGLSAAVLNFNRVPCLSTAVVRRLAAVATCNYFDDFGVLDFVCARGSGVSFLREAHNLMGLVLDAVKQGPMATQRHFLGILLDLTAALDKQILRINLKVGLREALRADIQVMLDQDQCTAAEAAKLRGRLTWAACGMFGRCGRAGQAALVQRQYRDSDAKLSDELRASLRFFQSLVQVVEPRTVFLGPRALPPLIVYTDASWELQEKDSPGLGFVLSHPDEKQCHSGATSPRRGLAMFARPKDPDHAFGSSGHSPMLRCLWQPLHRPGHSALCGQPSGVCRRGQGSVLLSRLRENHFGLSPALGKNGLSSLDRMDSVRRQPVRRVVQGRASRSLDSFSKLVDG